MQPRDVNSWLDGFGLDDFVRDYVSTVFATLPTAVQADLIDDPAFHLSDYEPMPGRAFHVRVAIPMARPMMLASASGELKTRVQPKARCRPSA